METIPEVPALPVVPPPAKKYYGHAISDGKIRFLSVSQITSFDTRSPEGCPRRWAYKMIFGKKEEMSDALKTGDQTTKELEHYLKTGIDVMSPVLRSAKHLFPKPGSDIESEKELARDLEKALELRDKILKAEPRGADLTFLKATLEHHAVLTANGIPFMGAADFRHQRGEYINADGILTREDVANVVEIGDLKTTKRINSETTRKGKVLQGWAKTIEQVIRHPQMLGYGKHAFVLYPKTTHVRLSHIYAQTGTARAAKKVTGLVPVEFVVDGWRGVESVTTEMEQVAVLVPNTAIARKLTDAEITIASKSIPFNTRACHSYNKDCPHMAYCDRPAQSVVDFLQIKLPTKANTLPAKAVNQTQGAQTPMSYGLFDNPQSPNGVYNTDVPLLAPTVPQTEIERAAEIEAEKQRLLGNVAAAKLAESVKVLSRGSIVDSMGHCKDCRVALSLDNISKLRDGTLKHIGCPGSVGAINPFDSPVLDLTKTAAPLKPEDIEMIEDTEIKERATAHAAVVAAQTPPVLPKAGKSVAVSCANSGETVPLSRVEAANKKVMCADCGQVVKVKVADDFETGVVAKHKLAAAVEPEVEHKLSTTPESPNAVYSMLPPPLPVVPPLPTAPAAPIERREHERFAVPQLPSSAVAPPPLPTLTPLQTWTEEMYQASQKVFTPADTALSLHSIAESLRELVAILKAK